MSAWARVTSWTMRAAGHPKAARSVLRPLRPAAAHAGEPPPNTTERVVSAETDAGTRAHLSVSTVAGTSYLNRAWVA